MIWRKVLFLTVLAFQFLGAQSFNFAGNDEAIRETMGRKINALYLFVVHVREWASITDTVSVYALPVESAEKLHQGRVDASIERTGPSALAIVLDERMVFYYPESGLKVIVAHELGHVVCGHQIEKEAPTGEEFDKLQAEADAVALALVGEDAVREMLEWLKFPPTYIETRLKKAEAVLVLNESGAIHLFPRTR